MFKIDTSNDFISIRNIERNRLNLVLDWYNSGDEYRYATGTAGPVSLDMLEQRYESIQGSDNEFFLGIYIPAKNTANTIADETLSGMVIGLISGGSLWIRLLTIASGSRGKGLGTMAVSLLLDYMKTGGIAGDVCLSVSGRNVRGRKFWQKNGFSEIKDIYGRTLFGTEDKIIIMQKRL